MKQHQVNAPCCTPPKREQARVQDTAPEDGGSLYEREVRHTQLLTTEQERELARLIKIGGETGRAALSRFVTANQRLIWKRALRFRGLGLDWEDLIQNGNEGLLTAIEKFDPGRGNKFSTMAVWWIDRALQRGIEDTGRTIRIPVYIHSALRHLKREELRLREENGYAPSTEELAEAMGLSCKQVEELRQLPECTASLSAPLPHDDDLELETAIADPSAHIEEEALDAAFSSDVLAALQDTLSSRELLVLQRRFGLGSGQDACGLAEIGRELGITRERARQIEEKALKKLRLSPQLRQLAAAAL